MATFATEGEGAADLFARPEFWRDSTLLDAPAPLAQDFFDLVVKGRYLFVPLSAIVSNADANIDGPIGKQSPLPQNDGYFNPPPGLDHHHHAGSTVVDIHESSDVVSLQDDTELDMDVDHWLSYDHAPITPPEFKTWDGFDASNSDLHSASFITEAGTSTYNSFLLSQDNPLGLKSHDCCKTLDSRGYLACLLALSLGRGSVLFAWNGDKIVFAATLASMNVLGYSGDSLAGIVRLCTSCGEASRRLHSFIAKTYSTAARPSRVALANALEKLLRIVHDELGTRGLEARSILQLQSLVRPVFALLSYFQRLVAKIKRNMNDSAILSLIFSEAHSAGLSEPFLRDTMCEILCMVSRPWTDLVEEWVGLRVEDGLPISKDGQGKGFVRVDNSMWIDDQGFELAEPDYFLDMDNMPTFVPDEVAQAIFETGRNLRFLQSTYPEHPLASLSTVLSQKLPRLQWQYDWEAIKRLEQKALDYQRVVFEALQMTGSRIRKNSERAVDGEIDDAPRLEFFGKDEASLEETVLASITQLNLPVPNPDARDRLTGILRDQLFKTRDEEDITGIDFSPHWSLLPLLSFGPPIYAQARLINRECLQLLYTEHDVRKHLRLQRAFQLLGNGVFSSRLANALFNPDMDTTERQAGVARSGGTMGLRLAGRENWPPASSELRLALMGVLSDSYQHTHWPDTMSDHAELPGDLSFAIRDLSPEEMEKCMDPDSLEALDFLRMSYKSPSALRPILTPAVLIKYDKIFRLLLRMLRMLFVVDQLFRDISQKSHSAEPYGVCLRFRIEAHHFVSSVARYFHDTGIDKPWRAFETWLDRIETGLKATNVDLQAFAVSPDRLGEQHERTLDEIMTALLLRKRQQPILNLLEEIFGLILRFAKQTTQRSQGADVPEKETTALYAQFRSRVEVFISVCKGMSEKSGYGQKRDTASSGMSEENPIVMLLLLLDMSNYYVKR